MVTAPLIRKLEETTTTISTSGNDGADSTKDKSGSGASDHNLISLSFPVRIKLGEINATLC